MEQAIGGARARVSCQVFARYGPAMPLQKTRCRDYASVVVFQKSLLPPLRPLGPTSMVHQLGARVGHLGCLPAVVCPGGLSWGPTEVNIQLATHKAAATTKIARFRPALER